jgi:predicted transcriptional regulator
MFGGKKNLSNLEHLVMDVLWKRGPSSSEDVRLALEKRHFMKESTARTISSAWKTRATFGTTLKDAQTSTPANHERMLPPEQFSVSSTGLYGGSVEELLVGMVDNEVVDSTELATLARKIARRKAAKES